MGASFVEVELARSRLAATLFVYRSDFDGVAFSFLAFLVHRDLYPTASTALYWCATPHS